MSAEAPEEGRGLERIEITVVVVPGRVRSLVTKLADSGRLRPLLIIAALVAVLAAGAGVALSLSTKAASQSHAVHVPVLAVGAQPRGLPTSVYSRFRIQQSCPRVTAVARGGAYVRVDFEHTGPCGVYGNAVALILHRVRGKWWPKFEAATWTCPIGDLPASVATQLGLCNGASRSHRH